MSENRIAGLLYLLTVLVCLNLGVSAYLLFRPAAAPAPAAAGSGSFSGQAIDALARRCVDMYNARRSADFYAEFDSLARVQFTEQVLSEQINKLHGLLGTIEEYAYDRTEGPGTGDGRRPYVLYFKVRLKGGSFSSGELKLSVLDRDGKPGLVGFFLNGQDNVRLN